MLVHPRVVYKYKNISKKVDFDRTIDTVKNNRIFLPTPAMLNDPMEANAVEINLGCAGSGYTLACGKVHPIIEEQQNQYRVLSLSAVPNSPIMWAHYADCYSGCCLIYSTEKSFSEVEPVIYTDLTFGLSDAEFPGDGIDDLSEAIKESLRFKHKDWHMKMNGG